MFFPFSSPIDLEELMCHRSQEFADKRQVENSPPLAILAQLRLFHCFGIFNSCLD
jgi:hypothetical protein